MFLWNQCEIYFKTLRLIFIVSLKCFLIDSEASCLKDNTFTSSTITMIHNYVGQIANTGWGFEIFLLTHMV